MSVMSNQTSPFGYGAKAIWNRSLDLDNNIIGFFVCGIAAYTWLGFYEGIDRATLLYAQGSYGLPALTILGAFASAVYLTLAGIILLSLKQPLSRYRTALPNLVAILAAFTAYIFAWVPSGVLLHVNPCIALFLIASGSTVVVTSLLFLRRAFSVTPQARFLVTAGPYSLVRHPMYVGNILSLLGLALLIDSAAAAGLVIICGGLQVARALYEEQILQANFSGYADYKARVGRFIPRLSPTHPLASAALRIFLSRAAGLKSAARW
jgi:protein-S-isoprenylcysteine O-methyltransferase Ste14